MSDILPWLESQGLGKYASVFTDNEIDLAILPELTEEDVRELGLPLGPRRKLLLAIARLKQSNAAPAETATEPPATTPEYPVQTTATGILERRHLSVMFVDLIGSTALATRMDPEELRDLLRDYQNTVAGDISRFEGFIARHLGDGVMIYFGWPRAVEDGAERAVRAGLAVAASVSRLTITDAQPMMVRIGIATGLVVVGDVIGDAGPREEEAVGETPNLAARLQTLAQPGTVVVSDATRRLCGGLFEFKSLGFHQLKGISEDVEAFCALAERVAENRYQAKRTEAVLPIMGRDQELAQLHDSWAQVCNGDGQMVLLTGEAGIGKSRVLRALKDSLGSESIHRLSYQCSPYHTDSALHPVITQLKKAARFTADDTNDTRLDKLTSVYETLYSESNVRLASLALQDLSYIAALLDIDGTARFGDIEQGGQKQRIRTLQVLISQVIGLAEQEPVLFLVEDAHWIDPTTLEFLEQLLVAIGRAKVMMVITARPAFQHQFSAHPNVTHLLLNRLGRSASVQIIERLGGGKVLPVELVDAIIRKTDGVPLYVEEFTKTILESALLLATKDTYQLQAPLGNIDIPSSLQDSLMSRLDRHSYKDIAQIAACLGREFDYELLASVVPYETEKLNAALDGLVDAQLMFRRGTPPHARYLFKHALVRDAAYQSLLKSTRQLWHARILNALENDPSKFSMAFKAHHALQANSWEKAVHYLNHAAQEAMARSAYPEAVNHHKQTLQALEHIPETEEHKRLGIDIRLDLRNCLMPLGEPEVELRYVNEAAERAGALPDVPRQARAACYECVLLFHLGKSQDALKPGEQAVDWAEELEDVALQIPSYFYLGQAHFSLGNFRRAIELFDQVVAPLQGSLAYESFGLAFLPATQPRAWAAMSYAELGQFDKAIVECQTAIEIADSADHPFSQATSYSGMGNVYLRQGEIDRALEMLEHSFELCKTWELSVVLAPLASSLGLVYALNGRIDDGIELIEQAASRMLPGRSVHWYARCHGALSKACLLAGRQQQARMHADDALRACLERCERGNEAWIRYLQGEIESDCGDTGAAHKHFQLAQGIASELGMQPLIAHCARGLAR